MDQSDTFSLDLQGGAHQSEERGVKCHHPITVQRHVHRNQTLSENESFLLEHDFLCSQTVKQLGCPHVGRWDMVAN